MYWDGMVCISDSPDLAQKCALGANRARPRLCHSRRQSPVVLCDARRRESARDVLVTLTEHALRLAAEGRADQTLPVA